MFNRLFLAPLILLALFAPVDILPPGYLPVVALPAQTLSTIGADSALPASVQASIDDLKARLKKISDDIHASPMDVELLQKRAIMLTQVQLYNLASDDYEDAFYLSERKPDLLIRQAYCMALAGDLDSALWLAHRTLKETKDFAAIHTVKALCLIERDPARALAEAASAIKLAPQDSDASVAMARVWLSESQYEMARLAASRALAQDAKNWQAYQVRAEAQTKLKNFKDALADSNKIIELYPASAAGYTSRGEVYRDMLESDKSERDFDTAFKIKTLLWQIELI